MDDRVHNRKGLTYRFQAGIDIHKTALQLPLSDAPHDLLLHLTIVKQGVRFLYCVFFRSTGTHSKQSRSKAVCLS